MNYSRSIYEHVNVFESLFLVFCSSPALAGSIIYNSYIDLPQHIYNHPKVWHALLSKLIQHLKYYECKEKEYSAQMKIMWCNVLVYFHMMHMYSCCFAPPLCHYFPNQSGDSKSTLSQTWFLNKLQETPVSRVKTMVSCNISINLPWINWHSDYCFQGFDQRRRILSLCCPHSSQRCRMSTLKTMKRRSLSSFSEVIFVYRSKDIGTKDIGLLISGSVFLFLL